MFILYDRGVIESEVVGDVTGITAYVSLVAIVLLSINENEEKTEPQYQAESEYSLEHIVTECNGEIDTTYVLTPKERNESKNKIY